MDTSRGQGRRPVPSHLHWCVPRDTRNMAQGGAGKETLIQTLLALCTRQQSTGSFPAPEGGCTELGRQHLLPSQKRSTNVFLTSQWL